MKQISSLIWKELHEARWFVAVALFLFFIMPVLGWVEGTVLYHHVNFYFDASPWVSVAGSGLAILVAVGSVCRDLNGKLEEFWRSRAVNVGQWLIMKYLVGLAVVLVACVPPLIIEIRTNRSVLISDTRTMVTWYPFLWIALYSLSFAAACMVRRVAHATMLALAALLLVYFLPIVIPFLQYLSIDWVLDRSHELRQQAKLATELPWNVYVESRQLLFVGGMLAISLVALIVSVAMVRRDWRVESSAKLLYGSVGAAALILFTSAAFRLASNLPVLQQVEVAPYEHVVDLWFEGSHGVLLTSEEKALGSEVATAVHTVKLTSAGVEIGPAISVRQNGWWGLFRNRIAWSGANPNVLYIVSTRSIEKHVLVAELRTFMLDGSAPPAPLLLWQRESIDSVHPFIAGGKLYVLGNEAAVLDITNPEQPQIISTVQMRWPEYHGASTSADLYRTFPPIPGLSPRQRLEAVVAWQMESVMEGELMAVANGRDLLIFHLDQLTDHDAMFRRVGQYKPAFLEQFFGAGSYRPVMANGLVYTSDSLSAGSSGLRFNAPRVDVFDVHDPTRPKEVGHFAIPTKWGLAVQPLPDGRALISGGNKLYVVGKPPTKD